VPAKARIAETGQVAAVAKQDPDEGV